MAVSGSESCLAARRLAIFSSGHGICYILFAVVLTVALVSRVGRSPIRPGIPMGAEIAGLPAPDGPNSRVRLTEVESKLDPNTANWSDLASLPGIGEVLAKRIVEFRQAKAGLQGGCLPVFKCPKDLEAVRGIGPKTVAKLASHLRFPESTSRPGG